MGAIPAVFTGYRWTESVLQRLLTSEGVVDREAVLAEATAHDDGNHYLDASELRAAAAALSARASVPTGKIGRGYRWSPSVLARIMSASSVRDADALIAEATRHDEGRKYLDGTELAAAAAVLRGRELGIISDLDETVIPPRGKPLPKTAYPGVAALYRELEYRDHGAAGEMSYVTARLPDRVVRIPRWLDKQAVPAGPISTGISTLPWEAEKEKVRDIRAFLDANPNRRFVMLGDSSHRDPEVYRRILADYPDRIAAVFIHQVTRTVPPERVEGMHLIANYAEAAADLLRLDELDEPAARRVMEAAQREGLEITDEEIERLIADNRP